MSLFFDNAPRLVVQGATGREARMVIRHTLAYGTPVVAGVTPGRGGVSVDGIPVFDTLRAAVAASGGPFDAALVSVPPGAALDAVAEAVAAGTPFICVSTENVPRHDALRLLAIARAAGVTLIGPNSVGVITPALRSKIGAIGGDDPGRAFAPGRIGVMSRSGGLTAEAALQLTRLGLGVSTAVSIGGDAAIGTTPAELLALFAADLGTDAVIYIGEPGTQHEQRLADALEVLRPRKPLIALVLGQFMEGFPRGSVFGHAGAVIKRDDGLPSAKVERLRQAGALVADSFDEVCHHALAATAP